MNGWIKLHRQIIEWEWFKEHETFKLFMFLLLKANHKEGAWQGVSINRGQILTGRKKLSEATGLSEQSVRTSLKRLKNSGEIEVLPTNKNSLITLVNYDIYQGEDDSPTSDLTNNQPATNQQSTSNQPATNHKQECNNNKNVKKVSRFVKPTREEIVEYIVEKQYFIDPDRFINHYESNGWKVGKNPMKNWKAALSNWNKNNNQSQSSGYQAKPMPSPED